MAIATLTAFKTALTDRRELLPLNVPLATVIAGRPFDLWVPAVPSGAAPTAAVVPTRATAGALGQQNAATGTLSIVGARLNSLNPGNYMVIDRLSHQGGLSGIVTTAQTTNLPTAALTRYTTGEGVWMALSIYTVIGTTATTVTCSYTNSSGTAGRTTQAQAFGGTANREAFRMIFMPFADGDTGVRSVESVTVLATTGTAGAFGVTLFKPLYVICVDQVSGEATPADFISGRTFGGIPEVVDGACLSLVSISQFTNAQGSGSLFLREH